MCANIYASLSQDGHSKRGAALLPALLGLAVPLTIPPNVKYVERLTSQTAHSR